MNREFDIIIYGATGYSGKLIAEYLVKHYSDSTRLALAGRNEAKLNALKAELNVDIPVLIADSADLPAVRAIAKRSQLVVSCTGPFLLYGSNMVQACAELGTDYVDVTGEVYWSGQMIAAHEQTAQQSGARIISCCGFDSVPSDLGVYLLQQQSIEARGKPFKQIKMRVQSLRGGWLGGSHATMNAMMERAATQADIIPFMEDAFALSPGFKGAPQPSGNEPLFDQELDSWAAPFLMHVVNSKIVHRSNWQLGFPYGEAFVYDEMSATGPGEAGKAAIEHSVNTMGGFNWQGEGNPAELQPGDGPDQATREAGYYSINFYGIEDGEVRGEVTIADDCDPGGASTCKLVSESAMCLLRDNVTVGGGFWTPVSAMAEPLYARLLDKQTLQISVQREAKSKG